MRRVLPLLAVLVVLIAPAAASAGPFVLSGSDPADTANSIPGLVSLDDGGGEFQQSTSGGSVIAGTGVGPIVYNSGGGGSIRQFSGGTYATLATNVPGVVGMTQTGRGLVVAIGNKLQYVSGGVRTDVPYGDIADGPWIAIATAPNGHLIGWGWNGGWGSLYDFDLSAGAPQKQDYAGVLTTPFFDNRDAGSSGPGPIANAGDIAADGQGGTWVAGVGRTGANAQIYYAAPGGSFNSVASNYYKPHITATGTGEAYASTSDYSTSPYLSDVYRFPGEVKVTSASGKLTNSGIFDLAVDRCYASCAVSPPSLAGPGAGAGTAPPRSGGGSTATTSSPLTAAPTSAAITKSGLTFTLRCAKACTVSISGSLAFGKAGRKGKKGTASAAGASLKLAATKVKLKAGRATKVSLKLTRSQRRAVKKAKHKKQKVTARVKLKIAPAGSKATTRSLTLKVR